jgi:uncharacterized membrane protein
LLPLTHVHSFAVALPTAIDAEPDLVLSCVEVAVITAVPTPAGVNTPEEVIAPSDAAQVTAELNDPVPCTVAAQVDVCVVRMDAGEQPTETEVIVDGAATVTVAMPDLVESCFDVAVMVAVPVPAGVRTPALLTVPMLVGLTDHVTDEL